MNKMKKELIDRSSYHSTCDNNFKRYYHIRGLNQPCNTKLLGCLERQLAIVFDVVRAGGEKGDLVSNLLCHPVLI